MFRKSLPITIVSRNDAESIANARNRINVWLQNNPGYKLEEYGDVEHVARPPRTEQHNNWVITVSENL